eukprot:CAMPEP_0203872936 /NCGR_PEP_ID=MMETSP0359-20131031/19495_1 /ASSEMBLY_ACC=CAM_ASM_000338 /TAXON_ID=268821 /ORGANISM="Scrippsiella Hangoei, Strain SHTV-5" /LENGTH=259 /DNA_ID=CAMNT_0050791627 /DNA_START=80 /DNA_END=859 /DNA_ORIENTATION=+
MVVMDFQGAATPPKKAQDWSPINRMLGAKKGGKQPSSKSQLLPQCPSNLPRPAQTPPATPGLRTTAATCTQSVTWEVLAAEAAASERSRANSLQKQVKALQAQLKEREASAGDDQGHAEAASEAARRVVALEAEVEALRRSSSEATAALEAERKLREEGSREAEEGRRQVEEERRKRLDERDSWEKEREALRADASRATWLDQELEKSREEFRSSRQAHKALEADFEALGRERDVLLERLEVEQAEIMARVAKLEKKGK